MVGKVCMVTYLNQQGQEVYWGVWIASGPYPCQGFSAVGYQYSSESGRVWVELHRDCCPEVDGHVYNCTTLAQPEKLDFGWLMEYTRGVGVDEDMDPGKEFHVSRLWMWHFMEGLVENGIMPKKALQICKIRLREEAKERWRLAQMMSKAQLT